jgi:ribulose-bisphosphate carboxylase large chain
VLPPRIHATYYIRSDARSIETRAQALAIEQSVEMPLAAIDDPDVRAEIVGQVEAIAQKEEEKFEVRLALASRTIGNDPGQLLNMLFGNSSLQQDVVLHDVELPAGLTQSFGGPRHGLDGLRRRVGADARALTCSPLKPQGLSPQKLADLAQKYAAGGIDFIKDDHGLADQNYAPFEARVAMIAQALRNIERPSGPACYVPSLSGDLETMRRQLAMANAVGVDVVMIAPMIAGVSNFHRLVREHPQVAFVAHPSMAGAASIAPALLLGKLFRVLGADAVIFPNYGGRFGYSPDTCRALAREASRNCDGLKPCVPVPAGGMDTSRVPEMLDFYGAGVMLLIGGALLETGAQLIEATAGFVEKVHGHPYVCDAG